MTQREISLDTETTGFKPSDGHRIVEIGCVEMINRIPTGNIWHSYINPQRSIPEGAFKVHGLSREFLADKPLFSEIALDFLRFIGNDSRLVIHNAIFDMPFINSELEKVNQPHIPYNRVFCTLDEARSRFPGSPTSLDALCKRFNINLSERTKHGALLDAELLASMYLELMVGSQSALLLRQNSRSQSDNNKNDNGIIQQILPPRHHEASSEELVAHQDFLKKFKTSAWGA